MEMDGVALRRRRQVEDDRARAWMVAYLGRVEKVPRLEEFTGIKPDPAADFARCLAAWDKIDAALRRVQ